jgi:diacylglycerol kinase family enzyme
VSRVGVIVNARAGTYRPGLTDELKRLICEAGVEARIREAREKGSVEAAGAELLAEGCDVLAAAGGDGTVSCVAALAAPRGIPLAVLPCGTLNHFAKDLRIPHDLASAVGVIRAGRTAAVDVGDVNGQLFINNSSLGIYPLFVRERQRHMRRRVGRMVSVVRAALRIARRIPMSRVRLTTGGTTLVRSTPFVFVGNNVYELEGLRLGSRPALDGGQLSVCVSEVVDAAGLTKLLARALTGRLREDREFEMLTTEEVWVETGRRRVSVARDGEVDRISGSLHYRVRPGLLRVLVPA